MSNELAKGRAASNATKVLRDPNAKNAAKKAARVGAD
jgi:hypothetical protein